MLEIVDEIRGFNRFYTRVLGLLRPDLDAGYLSRILGAFTTAGLVVRERSGGDGRRQIVRLTDAGRRAFADLDRLQADAIDALLAPLDEPQRKELVTSMG